MRQNNNRAGDMSATPHEGWIDHPVVPPLDDPESAAERIAEIRALLQDLDDTPHPEMTQLYYQHGFNELDLAVRDLLHIIDTGIGPSG